MPSEDPRISEVRSQVERGELGLALEGLRALAQSYSHSHLTAVSLQKSELAAIEKEELELGSDTALRERRKRLKRQLLKLADAIRTHLTDMKTEGRVSNTNKTALSSPYSSQRGEGPVNVLVLYAAADREGMEELEKSMALLRHLKRIELFGQHQVTYGQREKALDRALSEAEVVLLLVSNEFMASPECLSLQQKAYDKQQQQRLALVPILYTPAAHLDQLPIGQLQSLPRNGQPISTWDNNDKAYAGISRELGTLVDTVRDNLDYSADAVEQASEPPRPGNHQGVEYDRAALIKLFREGATERLIQELITVTERSPVHFKRALLLEQRWKAIKEDRMNGTAMAAELSVRQNQLNEGLLGLLTEMG